MRFRESRIVGSSEDSNWILDWYAEERDTTDTWGQQSEQAERGEPSPAISWSEELSKITHDMWAPANAWHAIGRELALWKSIYFTGGAGSLKRN
jgi:hypothetical protein